jgi:alpha-D-ribose 1-methylphosphonate 5-triphosphate synthase subunit PhnH
MTNLLQPGFADPVGQAQSCFRAVLDAMARPGHIHTVICPLPPPPLAPATAAVLLTLLDHDTPTWLDAPSSAAASWLAFHCGVVLAPASQAAFVVACELPKLAELHAGSDAAPEESATLIVQIAALGIGRKFRLRGPGLREPADFAASGLPADFVSQWKINHARFPRGVDLILCAGERVAALPRTVEIS